MKNLRGLVAVALLFLLGGCASSMRLEPLPAAEQEVVFERGNATVLSAKTVELRVGPAAATIPSDSRIRLNVVVHNTTAIPFDFSPANITASQGDGVQLLVLSAEQLQAEIDSQIRAQKIAAALAVMGNAMSAASAGYQRTTGTVTAYGGGAPAYGTFTATTYDSNAALAAQLQANSLNQNIVANVRESEREAAAFMDNALQRQTVMPGQWYGGFVEMAAPKDKKVPHEIDIHVALLGDDHQARLLYSPMPK